MNDNHCYGQSKEFMFSYEFPSFKEKHPFPIFLEMWATCHLLAMGYTLVLGGASNS